jgi:1-acyl-sn-glycerol-3-phosphate acyltransferase
MIYFLVRAWARLILRFFSRKITFVNPESLPGSGPILLASNHPNSFLDAIYICCALDRPVWSLARGDAFGKPWVKKILNAFCMMPIYRLSEGKENLGKNDVTFEACKTIFKTGGQVLIFAEGLCTNQSQLLVLKKGTARLSFDAWESIPELQVVPIGLSYDDYRRFGKSLRIEIGEAISLEDFKNIENPAARINHFNKLLSQELSRVAYQSTPIPRKRDNLLFWIGLVLHFPLYMLLQKWVQKKTQGTVFYDSVLYGFILVFLWVYWAIVLILFYFFI